MNKRILTFFACFLALVIFFIWWEWNLPMQTAVDSPQNVYSGVRTASQPDMYQSFSADTAERYLFPINSTDVYNNELQAYLSRQTRISGNRITMRAEYLNGKCLSGCAESRMAYLYGTFEFRVDLVEGKGIFPAIWLLPAKPGRYPEIDIFEMIGNRPDTVYGVLHYEKDNQLDKNFFTHEYDLAVRPETCVIRFEWYPDRLAWFIDGQPVYTIRESVPNDPMYFIFNLAIGGDWPGDPDENTVFPYEFEVEILDWKPQQVYER